MTFLFNEEIQQFQMALRGAFQDVVLSESRRVRMNAAQMSLDENLLATFRDAELFALWSQEDHIGMSAFLATAIESGFCLVPEPLVELLFYGPYLFSLLDPAFRESLSTFYNSLVTGAKLVSGSCEQFNGEIIKFGESEVLQAEHKQFCEVFGCMPTHSITGILPYVEGAEACDAILLFDKMDRPYLTWCAQRVDLVPLRPIDETLRAAEVRFKNAFAISLPQLKRGDCFLLRSLLASAEMYGAARRSHDMTVEYVKTRKQFGAPIGSFQAIQQGLADCHMRLEALFALIQFAGWAVDSDPLQKISSCQAVRIHADETTPLVAEKSIQYHGGIGFTWEYDLHLYLRRIKLRQLLFGPSPEDFNSFISSLE
jgi:Acyl-CoA dehydrogenase, C-terminal domain